ncbi:class III lanthionine synthetase LanKC [Streptacidiphilus melanogenes]|uniref:class III lanthionine synthetase LanKC n=1 Tax=Streptacidiphilus melanogenes TaxID=411235 RepID=UPI0005A9BD3A|nr:class III lanthionine synthetase LanKC [Streptacidiphilus melanogenes]
MDNRYEAYAYADPLFYDSPVRWGAVEEFAAAGRPLPDGWERVDFDGWTLLRPAGVALPPQGWKVHVSASLDDAEPVLERVRAYCLQARITFKFLRGLPMLQLQNSKYAPRGSSGKFCALYPCDEGELERCLTDLDQALAGRAGPYILSDLRWRQGPLYLRYGGFVPRHVTGADGERRLALETPDGRLVPDVRGPGFSVPSWAPIPDFVAAAMRERAARRNDALPYTVERVLHFSNAGGVYLAHRDDGTEPADQVVLKEARPFAGLDQRGEDAVTRLRHERDILERLSGLPGVPVLHELLKVWEHEFLVEEFVPGLSLNQWLGAHYPLVRPGADADEVADYTRRALDLIGRIEGTLQEIHARGVVFGDLHPRNVIVGPDDRTCFIDFELASPAESFVRPALGAAGFTAPLGRTGADLDHYAAAALRLWMFLPLAQLTALDPGKAAELADAIEDRFPVPPGFTDDIRRLLGPADGDGRRPRPQIGQRRVEVRALLTVPEAEWPRLRDALARGIDAMATPDRTDRLFPGDVAQFGPGGGLGLAHGAAGVLYALHVTGAAIDPGHVEWLVRASRTAEARPGLYTGGHGVAYALDLLGERQAALDLMDRLSKAAGDGDEAPGGGPAVPGLGAGSAGVALTLLHFADADGPHRLDLAVRLACHAADSLTTPDSTAPDGPAPGGPGSTGRPRTGLFVGRAGVALALVRLFEHTGDPSLLDRAERLLGQDLDRCALMPDGTLQTPDGTRTLPYLETGSTGIGLALEALLTHRPESPTAALRPQIVLAAQPEFVIQSGLFNGRAGLLGYLALTQRADQRAELRAELRADGRAAPAVDRHRRLLALHQISYHGEPAYPGDQLLRLSADLATGSAGVLLALGTALAGTPFLPWTSAPARSATTG